MAQQWSMCRSLILLCLTFSPVLSSRQKSLENVRENIEFVVKAPDSAIACKYGPPQLPAPVVRAKTARGEGFWTVKGSNYLDSQGRVVRFSGVFWSGLETPFGVPGGLQNRSYQEHIFQMKQLGFNMIRLPFSGDIVTKKIMPGWRQIDYCKNPDLKGKTSLEVMDKIIVEAGKWGIKVILDYHRMHQTWKPEIGTWFDEKTPESVWLYNWKKLSNRYKGNPTIIGVELFNEIHPSPTFPDGAPFWEPYVGKFEKYNFRRASLAAIKEVHAIEPNWIVFVQGTYHGPYWWGGNVARAMQYPITEPAGKIGYSTHDYGPYVHDMPWFNAPTFPRNLISVMRAMWGKYIEQGIAPVYVGEFGSFYPEPSTDKNRRERLVFEHQIEYIQQLKASWTIAFWGPNTIDTGSVLKADWKSVNVRKMGVLNKIMYPDFA